MAVTAFFLSWAKILAFNQGQFAAELIKLKNEKIIAGAKTKKQQNKNKMRKVEQEKKPRISWRKGNMRPAAIFFNCRDMTNIRVNGRSMLSTI